MLITKIIRAETKALDGTRVQAIVSDESEDRDGDIIRQAGWTLEQFQRHPVLLVSHDYMSLRSQIGEWEDMAVKGKRLTGVAHYYVGEGNEEADWAYNLASKGRAAYSVGFIPLEFAERESKGYEFTKQELLEVSHVSIPSNHNALQLMAKAVGLHPDVDALVKELLAEGTTQKAGRVMSQVNLDKLHKTMDMVGDIHQGTCDMGDDCPMKSFVELVSKPYANEHACRINDPGKYSEFRRANGEREHEGKKYDVIYGHLKDSDKWEEQAYRYPKKDWDVGPARSHCKAHEGTFEAASGEDSFCDLPPLIDYRSLFRGAVGAALEEVSR